MSTNNLPKEAKEMLLKNDHIRETMSAMIALMQKEQVQEIEMSLLFSPKIVPDIANMSEKKDTLMMSVTVQADYRKDFTGEHTADELIAEMHKRSALIANVSKDDSFPVQLQGIDFKNRRFEVNLEYRDSVVNDNLVWGSAQAADDIWRFLTIGVVPAKGKISYE